MKCSLDSVGQKATAAFKQSLVKAMFCHAISVVIRFLVA
jgi:hypothetical protein